MKKQNSKLAFSLIELSIVILIIGILVIGITKGSRIIRISKLKTAQNLTISSPVTSTDDLLAWYETTMDKSFLTAEVIDQGGISIWNDINPQSLTPNNTTTQGTAADMPKYMLNRINGLPTLNFDGATDYLPFDGNKLVGTNYTIIVVERRVSASTMWIISGTSTSTRSNLHFGYVNPNQFWFNHYGDDYQTAVPVYSSPITRVITLRYSSALGRNLIINSGAPALGGSTLPLLSYPGARIGGGAASNPYNGDIAEVIMFTRYLTETERLNIEKYLKQKWGVR